MPQFVLKPSTKEKMETTCKNCYHKFEGNYCNQCGQSADTHELNMHFIWHDLQHGLLHVDRGIFYTIGQLLYRPGHVVREFINGKRVRHFKPIALVVILATLNGLLFHLFIDGTPKAGPISDQDDIISVFQNVSLWIINHMAYAALFLIVTTSLASYQVFKKQGHNFAEHLVLNTFFIGLVLVINLLLLPVIYVYPQSETYGKYYLISQSIFILLMYLCYVQFFTKISWLKTLILTVLAFFFMMTINVFIGYVVSSLIKLIH